MGDGLRMALFGKPEITAGGTPVRGFVYNKALALLAYLAVTRRPHSRDALAGLLWGEMPEANAKANLRKILAVLRDVVGPHLLISRQTVAFDTASRYWLDTEVFESKLLSLTAPSMLHTRLSEGAVSLLDEAVKLYGGDLLEGFYVHDAPAFEEWVLPERERYRQMVLQALYDLAAYSTLRRNYAKGMAYTSRLLALEPWREEVHQQMMQLLALSGQRGAALAQYEKCCRLLANEMGVLPSAETVALYQRILSGQIYTPTPSTRPPGSHAPSYGSWPAEATPFVGRAEELAAVAGRISSSESRLVTIMGLSGAGKTRLALQAAAEALRSFRHGVSFTSLAAVTSSGQLLDAIVESLGLASDRPLAERPERHTRTRLLEYLRDKEVLLVLDQFEHLPEGAWQVADLLQHTSGVKVLVTSLERLNLRGEWSLPLLGLGMPASDGPEAALESDAVRLFLQGARRTSADREVANASLPAVVRICRLVEGLPLAIELASAWTRVLSSEEIASEIQKTYGFLTGSSHDSPERHASLKSVFDQSWRPLTGLERLVFSRLCVFDGGFTRDAAERVAETSLPLLASLIDKSLVRSTPFGRYAIHGLLRQYGLERLAGMDQEDREVRARHADYYTTLLRQKVGRFEGLWQDDALPEIAVERENLRLAWGWSLSQA